LEHLRERNDDEHDASDHGAKSVDGRAGFPSALVRLSPVDHHAGLGEGERYEHADHVERDERMRVAAEYDEQQAGEQAESDDAVGKSETIALIHELARQIAIPRQN